MNPMSSSLPIETEETALTTEEARRRRRQRRRRPVWLRRVLAALWLVPRKISRLHRRLPLPAVAAFYLLLIAIPAVLLWAPHARRPEPPPPGVSSAAPAPQPARDARQLAQEASRLIAAKDFAAARAIAGELRQLDPDNANAFVIEGTILAEEKNYPAAREAFAHAVDLAPGSSSARFNLAEIDFVSGRYAEAEQSYAALKWKMSGNPVIPFRLYLCAHLLGRREDARAFLDDPAVIDRSAEWYFIRGVEALVDGKRDEAQKLFTQSRLMHGRKAVAYDRTLERLGLVPK